MSQLQKSSCVIPAKSRQWREEARSMKAGVGQVLDPSCQGQDFAGVTCHTAHCQQTYFYDNPPCNRGFTPMHESRRSKL